MADVNTRRRYRDRAQMLLIAAFGVAVMLVALALILNTSIYTENIATRGSDISGGKDALRFRAVTEDALVGIVRKTNAKNQSDAEAAGDYHPLWNGTRTATWDYANYSGRLQASDSIVANLSIQDGPHNGTEVYQDSDGNFSDERGEDWEVVDDSQGIRDFSINATKADMRAESPGGATTGALVFYVDFHDASTPYNVFIYEHDSNSGKFIVQVNDGSGTELGRCKQDYETFGGGERARVDLTNASAGGSHCSALEELQSIMDEEFDVAFENTCVNTDSLSPQDCSSFSDLTDKDSSIEGTFDLTVNASFTSVPSSGTVDAGTSGSNDHIDKRRAVYSIVTHLVYESKRLYYETVIRVAPGEPDA